MLALDHMAGEKTAPMLSELTSITIIPDIADIPVADQGIRPICVAMAVTGAHEIERSRHDSAPWVLLSPEAIWGHAWQKGLAGPDGTSVSAIANALQTHGQPKLSEWPLNAVREAWSRPPKAAGPPPWLRAGLDELPLSRDHLQEKLLEGHAVVLVIHVTEEFHNADSTSGRVGLPSPHAQTYGLHAVLCVGQAKDDAGETHFLIRNSWGTGWGNSGYAWVPWEYVGRYGTQMGLIRSVW